MPRRRRGFRSQDVSTKRESRLEKTRPKRQRRRWIEALNRASRIINMGRHQAFGHAQKKKFDEGRSFELRLARGNEFSTRMEMVYDGNEED